MLLQTIKWFPQIPDPLSRHKRFHIIPILLSILFAAGSRDIPGQLCPSHFSFSNVHCRSGSVPCYISSSLNLWWCSSDPFIMYNIWFSALFLLFCIAATIHPSVFLLIWGILHMQWWSLYSFLTHFAICSDDIHFPCTELTHLNLSLRRGRVLGWASWTAVDR